MNTSRPRSLIVALSEARRPSNFEAVEPLKRFTQRLALIGSDADGALELVYMRGFQAGYEQALRDGKKATKAKALEPSRGAK